MVGLLLLKEVLGQYQHRRYKLLLELMLYHNLYLV